MSSVKGTGTVTGRRQFLKAAAASAVMLAARGAHATGSSYPFGLNVGPCCELTLWLGHYRDATTPDPWTIERIFSAPLITNAGQDGLLDQLIQPRLIHATSVTNSHGQPMITATGQQSIDGAISTFARSSDNNRFLSMIDLILGDVSYDPKTNPNPSDDLHIMLKALHDNGLSLPSNYIGQSTADKVAIYNLLFDASGRVPLFDCWIPVAGGAARKLGQMNFSDLFNVRLQDVYTSQRASFYALKLAKDAGILRPHSDRAKPPHPDGTFFQSDGSLVNAKKDKIGVLTVPNQRCCDVSGTGECVPNAPNKYCSAVSGTDPHCNAMSDPCN